MKYSYPPRLRLINKQLTAQTNTRTRGGSAREARQEPRKERGASAPSPGRGHGGAPAAPHFSPRELFPRDSSSFFPPFFPPSPSPSTPAPFPAAFPRCPRPLPAPPPAPAQFYSPSQRVSAAGAGALQERGGLAPAFVRSGLCLRPATTPILIFSFISRQRQCQPSPLPAAPLRLASAS